MKGAAKRLAIDLRNLQKDPADNCTAKPSVDNVLVWNYVIFDMDDDRFRGGQYWGELTFPPEYPMKPPSIKMMTPNGRFKTNERLCLSISDFHPESWSPSWSVRSILLGITSFMADNVETYGSIKDTPMDAYRKFAAESHAWNAANVVFKSAFPELVRQ